LIEVQGLTRCYDGRTAVADLSFTVARGEVLGVAGPDGAGKTTTMRVLAGVLDPTSGSVTIAGHDVVTRSREARRHLGYLAAEAPVDAHARVEGYLGTMCRLRGVEPDRRRARIDLALRACGLDEHRREVVGRLPEELRRRVGLAQATVHDPDALLLDEPGPEGELIRSLGRGRAVVVTGRAASELAGVCDRVLLLEAGRLVAEETPAALSRRPRGVEVVVVVRGDPAAAERHVRELAGVSAVATEPVEGGGHRLTVTGDRDDLQDAIARAIVEHGLGLRELSSRPAGGGE
jgi:ABC-2 type transport system ATP-binding protein